MLFRFDFYRFFQNIGTMLADDDFSSTNVEKKLDLAALLDFGSALADPRGTVFEESPKSKIALSTIKISANDFTMTCDESSFKHFIDGYEPRRPFQVKAGDQCRVITVYKHSNQNAIMGIINCHTGQLCDMLNVSKDVFEGVLRKFNVDAARLKKHKEFVQLPDRYIFSRKWFRYTFSKLTGHCYLCQEECAKRHPSNYFMDFHDLYQSLFEAVNLEAIDQ